jgi:hypothetical protein
MPVSSLCHPALSLPPSLSLRPGLQL